MHANNYNLKSLFSAIKLIFFAQSLYGHQLTDLPWSMSRHSVLVEEAQKTAELQLPTFPSFEYPIEFPQSVLDLFIEGKAVIFTYGSLLCKHSASRTISPEALKTFQPAVALGVKRVYDRHIPISATFGKQPRKNDTAMLNLWIQYDLSHVANGILVTVDMKDLHKLCQREVGYDLIPIPVTLWEEALNTETERPHVFIAYTFSAPRNSRGNLRFTHPCINPYRKYANMVNAAARDYGETYFQFLKASTYLSDGITPFNKWDESPDLDQASQCQHP